MVAIKDLWNNNEEFRTNVIETWNEIQQSISDGINQITAWWEEWGPTIIGIITPIWEGIKTVIETVIEVISGIISLFINVLTGDWEGAWEDIKGIVETIWKGIEGVIRSIAQTIEGIWDLIVTTATNKWNGLSDSAKTIWEGIKGWIVSPIESAKTLLFGIIDSIAYAFSSMSITIPTPKLPHISISTNWASVGNISIPYPDFDINWYAKGTNFHPGGWAVVGEEGPELLNLQNEIENTSAFVFQTETDGILIMDAATFETATKAMKLGGGIFALANSKTGDQWDWRTFGDGAGFTADEITAGLIDAGLIQVGPTTTFAEGYDPSQIEAGGLVVGMGIDSDCVDLYHFDGNLNSSSGRQAVHQRSSIAYDSEGNLVAASTPVCDVSKFGKGVYFGGPVTNLLSANQSSVETDLTGLAITTGTTSTIARSSTWAHSGSYSMQVNVATANDGFITSIGVAGTAGQPYIGAFIVKGAKGKNIDVYLYDATNAVIFGRRTVTVTSDEEIVSTVPGATLATTSSNLRIYARFATVGTYYVDCLQIANKAYLPPWQIGGTARTGDVVTIPTTGMSAAEGTISWWMESNAALKRQVADYSFILRVLGGVYSSYAFRINHQPNTATSYFYVYNDAATPNAMMFSDDLIPDGWHMMTITWDDTNVILYIDGAEAGRLDSSVMPSSFGASMYLGYGSTTSYIPNTTYDELRIDKITRTAGEIKSWYDAQAPFYGSQELAQLPGYVKIETDGLKVYDGSGNERVTLGSWLESAVRTYGLKVVGGKIYASVFNTGAVGSTASYVEISKDTSDQGYLKFVGPAGLILDILTNSNQGIINWYDAGTLKARALINSATTKELLLSTLDGNGLMLSTNTGETLTMGPTGGNTSARGIGMTDITGDLLPRTDNGGQYCGSDSNRWSLVRGKYVTPGDLAWEEETCAICGERFADGDTLVLLVKTIDEMLGTLTVPIHDRCKDVQKTITLTIPEKATRYRLNDQGELEPYLVFDTEETEEEVFKLQPNYELDSKTGEFYRKLNEDNLAIFGEDALKNKVIASKGSALCIDTIKKSTIKTRTITFNTGKQAAL